MAANSTDATWSQADSEEPDGKSAKKKGLNLSFNKRIVLVMLAVSLITVLSSIAVLSFVWGAALSNLYARKRAARCRFHGRFHCPGLQGFSWRLV